MVVLQSIRPQGITIGNPCRLVIPPRPRPKRARSWPNRPSRYGRNRAGSVESCTHIWCQRPRRSWPNFVKDGQTLVDIVRANRQSGVVRIRPMSAHFSRNMEQSCPDSPNVLSFGPHKGRIRARFGLHRPSCQCQPETSRIWSELGRILFKLGRALAHVGHFVPNSPRVAL